MTRRTPAAVVAVLVTAGIAPAQVGVSNLATGVSQNFDTLSSAASGSSNAFTGNVTLPGFYSNQPTYLTNAGGLGTGGLQSFGAALNSDRALGAITTGSFTPVHYMLTVRNDSGLPISAATVGFDGEQWRAASANTLQFSYQTSATNLTSTTAGTFVDFDALDFASTSNPGGTGMGVFPPAVTAKSATITLPGVVNPGDYIAFRWSMTDTAGVTDPGLGIDNLAITFTTPVPEPITGLGLAAAGLGLVRLVRRRYLGNASAQEVSE